MADAGTLAYSFLRRRTVGQLLRFGFTTGLSAIVSVGLPAFLHEILGIEQKIAVAISQSTVLLLNFLMIRAFVFRSRRGARRDLAYYVGSTIGFRTAEYGLFLVLFELAGLYYLTALVVTLGISTVIKFFWYRNLFGAPAEGQAP